MRIGLTLLVAGILTAASVTTSGILMYSGITYLVLSFVRNAIARAAQAKIQQGRSRHIEQVQRQMQEELNSIPLEKEDKNV